MRRFAVILLLVTIISAIGWWLLHWRAANAKVEDPWKALPPNTALILEVPSPLSTWQRFTGTSQFWVDLEKIPGCAAINTVLGRIAAKTTDVDALAKVFDTRAVVIALEPRGEDTGMLLVWPMSSDGPDLAALGAAVGADHAAWQALGAGSRISMRPDSAWPTLEVAWSNGLLIASDRTDMVDEALQRLSAGNTSGPDSLLTAARATLGSGSDAHLILQPARCARSISAWFPHEMRDALQPSEGWAALDIRLRPGTLLVSGLLFNAPNDPCALARTHQVTGKSTLARVLPANVCALRTTRITDAARYVLDMPGNQPDTALFARYGAWVNGTIGIAEARSAEDTLTHAWAVLQTQDAELAQRSLTGLCPGGACDTSSYRGIRINGVADHDAFGNVFGADFSGFPQPLWVLLQDKVVLANTPADMRACIDAWTDGTSLALDPRSGDFFRQYSSDAITSRWVDVARVLPLWHQQSTATAHEKMDAALPALGNMGGCLLELVPQRQGVTEISFCLQHMAGPNAQAGSLWSASIGAPLERPPFLLQDHLSRTMLVLAQDREHRIDLISCTGKVLWQRQLDSTIMGEVHQIDRFKNGKLQMLFNTSGQVYLIDRNGKDVAGFPIALPQGASAPLSVFDYDGTKDYRILQPTLDGRVANYGMEGKPVSGWAPVQAETPALNAVEHWRIANKDYLITVGRNGSIAVTDRAGAARFAATLKLASPVQVLGVRTGTEIANGRVDWIDSTGAVLGGTLDGKVDTLAISTTGDAIELDVGGEGTTMIIRTTTNTLSASDAKGNIFSISLPDTKNNAAFPVTVPGKGTAIGVALPDREEIRLYRTDGTLWNGFPLKGALSFRIADINLDGALEVVTATNDGHVVAYALPVAATQ